jgi:hypothetical protein
MLPAILIGGGVSYLFSRLLAEDTSRPVQRFGPPQQVGNRPPGSVMQIDAHCEPQTRAGLERLLTGGTPEQLDQAAHSLLRTGYPLAAQACAMKAEGMRRFNAEVLAGKAKRDQMFAAQAAQQATLQAQAAQAQAIGNAGAVIAQVAALPKPEVGPQVATPLQGPQGVAFQGSPPGATVGVDLPPGVVAAPPTTAPGEAPLKKSRKPYTRKVKAAIAGTTAEIDLVREPFEPHANGRANPEH